MGRDNDMCLIPTGTGRIRSTVVTECPAYCPMPQRAYVVRSIACRAVQTAANPHFSITAPRSVWGTCPPQFGKHPYLRTCADPRLIHTPVCRRHAGCRLPVPTVRPRHHTPVNTLLCTCANPRLTHPTPAYVHPSQAASHVFPALPQATPDPSRTHA